MIKQVHEPFTRSLLRQDSARGMNDGSKPLSKPDDIRKALWNDESQYAASVGTPVGDALLEQYRLYVEMADRISQRRGATNTFFLAFNTAIVGALAGLFNDVPANVALAFYVAAAAFSITWAVLLRSYRTLNTAKFKVIGLIEERLPCSPYWAAEWKALDEGKNWRKHVPLGPIETVVPAVFIIIYGYLAMLTITAATPAG